MSDHAKTASACRPEGLKMRHIMLASRLSCFDVGRETQFLVRRLNPVNRGNVLG